MLRKLCGPLALLGILVSALPALGAYTYYYTDAFPSVDGTRWSTNGSVNVSSGLTAPAADGGSLISKLPVPDGTAEYEVRAKLTLGASGGSYLLYLRASQNARLNPTGASTGTFLAFEILNPTFSAGGCSATIRAWRGVSGTVTLLSQSTIPCYSGMEVRAVAFKSNQIALFLDGIYYQYWVEGTVLSGLPGVGGFGMPSGNSIARGDLGPIDRVAPSALPANTIATSVFDTRVEIQWPGTPDDANGIGIWGYQVFRNGVYQGLKRSPEIMDDSVQPGTTYSYTIEPADMHGNAPVVTTISVTTPPAGNIEPRKLGVRALGTYWGSLGEQIDLQSGNLNYSLPLFRAQGRGNWGVSFALSYNSQNWRLDTAGAMRIWNHGRDIGYGHGWRLSAGSMTPVYRGYWDVGLFRFTDSSGAEYRFTQNSAGKWTTKEGLYLTYDEAARKLYFPDGSWWYFGAVSGGTEMDTGTMYPTLFQDSNGNQVIVRYRPAKGMSTINGSGRVDEVEDVRAKLNGHGLLDSNGNPVYATWKCSYNESDPLRHISICGEYGSSGANLRYNFSWGTANTALTDPWLGTNFGTKTVLRQVEAGYAGSGIKHRFEYDWDSSGSGAGPGELTKVTYPYGGTLSWHYSESTLAGGRKFRRVHYRLYNDGSGEKWSTLDMYPGPNAELPVHDWSVISDPTGTADKAWWWTSTLGSPAMGLPRDFAERDRTQAGWPALTHKQIIWAVNSTGNPYISATVDHVDPNTASAKSTRTEQDIDGEGRLLARRQYGFTGALERTYTYSYAMQDGYLQRHIKNLVTSVTLTGPQSPVTLVSNLYDGFAGSLCGGVGYLNQLPNARQLDISLRGVTFRGNLTYTKTPGSESCMYYHEGGGVLTQTDRQGHSVSITPDASKNYAVPQAITTGSLGNTMGWNDYLSLTQNNGPNTATSTFSYDTYQRKKTETYPNGVTVTHEYSISPPLHKQITGSQWVRTDFDGFGRTRVVLSGHNQTEVSRIITEYAPCACSPIGKVHRVSIAHAPTATLGAHDWTTYTYDALGRTIQVTPPGNAGSTTTEYKGNTVKIIEPTGKWKKFEQDAFGNLVKVYEPRPGGGADYETVYTYSMLNQLLTVTMARPGLGSNPATVTQTRTFVYNAQQRLQSVTHPESGTTTYTYNPDGTVQSKTDAKGNQLNYSYDSLGRGIKVSNANTTYAGHPDPPNHCSDVTTSYDGQTIDSTFQATYAQGRVAAVTTGCDGYRGGKIDELYAYNPAGAVVTKRIRVSNGGTPIVKDIHYSYDAMGRLQSMLYPHQTYPFVYSYDPMGRLSQLTQNGLYQHMNPDYSTELREGTWTWVDNVSYGHAGELLKMDSVVNPNDTYPGKNGIFSKEVRTYNSRAQLTRQYSILSNVSGAMYVDVAYEYSTSMNDGRITARNNLRLNERVTYEYDSLNRLIGAATDSSAWGVSFTYDGFGNRWDQTVTKGTAPPMAIQFNQANNRISTSDYVYDAAGNITRMPSANGSYDTLTYDVYNRLVKVRHYQTANTEEYGYTSENKRFWKQTKDAWGNITSEEYYIYGADGRRIATYDSGMMLVYHPYKIDVYFGNRQIWSRGTAFNSDRLGSVEAGTTDFLPFGEEKSATANNRTKFATYHRDMTGLDYADQRYYSPRLGRFLTVDPSGYADPADPGSWDQYAYVGGDPVNFNDPSGLKPCGEYIINGADTLRNLFSGSSEFSLLNQLVWAESAPARFGFTGSDNWWSEKVAIASSVVNRHRILSGQIQIAGVNNVATLGWGPAGATFRQIMGWTKQYEVMTGGPSNPRLESVFQTRLNSVLAGEGSDMSFTGEDGGLVEMSIGCFNLWQGWVATLRVVQGLELDPFRSQGVTTSFNSDPKIRTGGLETRFGSSGTANTFYGIPSSSVGATPVGRGRREDEKRQYIGGSGRGSR